MPLGNQDRTCVSVGNKWAAKDNALAKRGREQEKRSPTTKSAAAAEGAVSEIARRLAIYYHFVVVLDMPPKVDWNTLHGGPVEGTCHTPPTHLLSPVALRVMAMDGSRATHH